MKIIQISDLHLCTNPLDRPHGIDVWKNFRQALDKTMKLKPDMVVLTGDLCMDTGEAGIYEKIAEWMSDFSIPWYALPGNHDNAELMEAVMGNRHCRRRHYWIELTENYAALMLHSGDGVMLEEDATRIHKMISQIPEKILVFVHHPIIKTPVPYMELNYPLKGRSLISDVLMKRSDNVLIFCGHHHAAICSGSGNLIQWIAPSTYFQIDPDFELFETDHRPPGLREIVLDGPSIHTRVILLS